MTTIFDPVKINTLVLKNRFYAAPMVSNFATGSGYVTPALVEYYRRTARGGWGVVCVEATAIRGDSRTFAANLGNHDDTYIPGLSEIAEAIHEGGAQSMIQLFYPGRQGNQAYTLPHLKKEYLAPSGSPAVAFSDINPREMTTQECEELAEVHALAAERAMKAGFDLVQFHAAHGFLIQQFMSPWTNHRTDRFKDPLEFTREVMKRTRARVGNDYPISIRLSAREYVDGGIDLEYTLKTLAPGLENAGIDWIDVAAGVFESIHRIFPPIYFPWGVDGPDLTSKIKEVVKIPVSGRGRINNLGLARKYVEDGLMDIVTFGRQRLCDMEFPNKVMENRLDEIKMCMACDACCANLLSQRPIRCAFNYNLGREARVHPAIRPSKKPRKVVIAGGGVAGMQAALTATLRGHKVTLYEKSSELGGLVNLAASFPKLGTGDLANSVRYLNRQLKKHKVPIKLNTQVTPELIKKLAPDIVIVATGSDEIIPEIPGIDNSIVMSQDRYLKKEAVPGKNVIVIGGMYGSEAALSLARDGHRVTLVSETPAADLGKTEYTFIVRLIALWQMMKEEKNLEVLTEVRVKRITDNGAIISDKTGGEKALSADSVLVCGGRKANQNLALTLRGTVKKLYEIGDCVKPGKILDAMSAAERICRAI